MLEERVIHDYFHNNKDKRLPEQDSLKCARFAMDLETNYFGKLSVFN